MAKDARQKCIFFASWTGAATAAATSNTFSGEDIASVTVNTTTFGSKVNNTGGTYEFVYSTTGSTWKLNGTAVDLATDYGVTVTLETSGSLGNGDTVTVTYTPSTGGWEALGKDVDDLSKDLNPDTENTKNVLGETAFEHKGYQSTVGLDTYYMDPSRLMYAHLLDVALTEKYDEASLLGYYAEAYFTTVNENANTMTGYCYVRRAWIVPQSVGGNTAGFSIPITVNPQGTPEKKAITYDMKTNTATVTTWTDS